jgi:hypothetical protein
VKIESYVIVRGGPNTPLLGIQITALWKLGGLRLRNYQSLIHYSSEKNDIDNLILSYRYNSCYDENNS